MSGYKKGSGSGFSSGLVSYGNRDLNCSYRLDIASSQYIDFGDSFDSVLTGTEPTWTQVIVFRRRSVSNVNEEEILSKWAGAGNQRSYRLQFNTNNRLRFDYASGGTTPVSYTAESVAFLTNVTDFYYLAITFDGSQTVSADVFDFYLGGTGIISKTVVTDLDSGGSHNIFASSATDKIGALVNGAGNPSFFLDALVNQYYIFNRVLSTAELNTLYNSGSPINPTGTSGLVHNYQMNEPSSSWDGSKYDVLDSEGAVNGETVNLLQSDKVCD